MRAGGPVPDRPSVLPRAAVPSMARPTPDVRARTRLRNLENSSAPQETLSMKGNCTGLIVSRRQDRVPSSFRPRLRGRRFVDRGGARPAVEQLQKTLDPLGM